MTQLTMTEPVILKNGFWIGLVALAAGVVVLIVKFAGGSDSTRVAPSPNFKAQLPPKTTALTTSGGSGVKSYEQLPSEVKQAILGFMPGVLRGNYGASWKYTAPNITHGASQHTWATLDARSVVPMPGYTLHGATYRLEEATTKEVLVVLRLHPSEPSVGRTLPMRIGLSPYGTGAHKRWLVNYWMPATNFAKPGYTGDD